MVVCLGLTAAALALRAGAAWLPKQLSVVAAAQGPDRVQLPSGDTAPHDAGAKLVNDSNQAGPAGVFAAVDTINERPPPSAPTEPEKTVKTTELKQAAIQTGIVQAEPQRTSMSSATTESTGWSVQLAAPNSEVEAKNGAEELNARFASDLNGSSIGVHKAVVNGQTIYRLRVVGLSKADALALCAHLKGDRGSCFVTK